MDSPSSPKPTRTANFIALNLEAYEVAFQLVFGRLKIEFSEDFSGLRQNAFEMAYHTSEAPGLPAL